MEISSISFAIRRSESFDGRESPRLPRFSAFRLSKNRHWDHGLRVRLIRESKLSCIIHGRDFAPPSSPLPSSPSSPPPRSATRRLLNRKLLEFPSRREIYRAYGIYVAEKTPRFTPPSCLPRRQEPRPRSTTDLFFSTFFFSLYFFLFFNTPFTANVSLRIKCDSRYISRSNTHTHTLSLSYLL